MSGLPLWDVPVGAIRPGDVITTSNDDVTVDAIEPLGPEGPYPNGYRIKGRITRGFGRGKTVRSWSYHRDHLFPTIRRPRLRPGP